MPSDLLSQTTIRIVKTGRNRWAVTLRFAELFRLSLRATIWRERDKSYYCRAEFGGIEWKANGPDRTVLTSDLILTLLGWVEREREQRGKLSKAKESAS